RGQYGGGERLVDLEEVDVLERQAVAGEQARYGGGRCHEQALVAVHEVDGGRLGVDELRQDRQLALLRPLTRGEQHRRGAVGQRRRVACRHRRGGIERGTEHGPELRELLQRGVGAQVVVAGEALVRGDEVVEESGLPRARQVLVRGERDLVLRLARDAPLRGGDRLVLAHGQVRARLARARADGREVLGADREERLDLRARGPGVVRVEQRGPQAVADDDRRVGDGVGAA